MKKMISPLPIIQALDHETQASLGFYQLCDLFNRQQVPNIQTLLGAYQLMTLNGLGGIALRAYAIGAMQAYETNQYEYWPQLPYFNDQPIPIMDLQSAAQVPPEGHQDLSFQERFIKAIESTYENLGARVQEISRSNAAGQCLDRVWDLPAEQIEYGLSLKISYTWMDQRCTDWVLINSHNKEMKPEDVPANVQFFNDPKGLFANWQVLIDDEYPASNLGLDAFSIKYKMGSSQLTFGANLWHIGPKDHCVLVPSQLSYTWHKKKQWDISFNDMAWVSTKGSVSLTYTWIDYQAFHWCIKNHEKPDQDVRIAIVNNQALSWGQWLEQLKFSSHQGTDKWNIEQMKTHLTKNWNSLMGHPMARIVESFSQMLYAFEPSIKSVPVMKKPKC